VNTVGGLNAAFAIMAALIATGKEQEKGMFIDIALARFNHANDGLGCANLLIEDKSHNF